MASRRNLKKSVNYISNLLIGMCIYEGAMADEAKREALKPILLKACKLAERYCEPYQPHRTGKYEGILQKTS